MVGGDIIITGAAGSGKDLVSCRRCMEESAAKDASKWVLKSCRGSAPVDENNDTMEGCIEFENMFFMFFVSDRRRDSIDLGSFQKASA